VNSTHSIFFLSLFELCKNLTEYISGYCRREYFWKDKCGKLQVKCTDKYAERGEGTILRFGGSGESL